MPSIGEMERYLHDQKNFNAHAGDIVTVLCKARSFEAGWQSPWASNMDAYINHQASVIRINENGICLRKADDNDYPSYQGGWYFPYFVISICR